MSESILERRPQLILAMIAAAMLVGALGPWPYSYYQILRFLTSGSAVYIAFLGYNWKKSWVVWLFGVIALLFNPLIPIHLSKEIWQPIDIICAWLFVIVGFVLKKPKEQKNTDLMGGVE
jgi:hypothetical protein